jgi:hypothetical protein
MDAFSARIRDAIDFVRDFVNEDLRLTCMRQVESCLQPDGFETGRAVCLTLTLDRAE